MAGGGRSGERVFWAVALAATCGRLLLVWTGFPETGLLADDAFYYFTIARNLAAGLGPTFDGLFPTNGFHPLWQLLLAPVWRLAGDDPWLPVRLALSLTVLCDLGSGRLIRGLAGAGGGRGGGANLAAAAWFLLPAPALLGLRGLESSLSTLLVLVLLRQLAARRPAAARGAAGTGGLRPALAAGLLLGLCGLARTDNLPLAGLAAGAVLLGAGSRRLARLLALAGGAAVVSAPWFLWNLATFGDVIQVSGRAKLLARGLFGALPWDWSDPVRAADSAADLLAAPLRVPGLFLCGEEFTAGRWSFPLFLLTLAGLATAAVCGLRALRRRGRQREPAVIFAVVYLLAHVAVYGAVWRAYASWYAHTVWALLILLAAAAAREAAAAGGRGRRTVRLGLAVAVAAQLLQWPLFLVRVPHGARGTELRFAALQEQVLVRAAARRAGGDRLPLVLGAFDAGALGYLLGRHPDVTVTNLDGLVNNAAFAAARDGRYEEWILQHVDYLAQDPARARLHLDSAGVERLRQRYR
jgi:hypothetical protein